MSTLRLIWDVWTSPGPLLVVGVVAVMCIGVGLADRGRR
jgi:hypothetical protein